MQTKFLKPTPAEQGIVDTISHDKDITIDTSMMHVRRTSSRACFTVEHGDYNGTDLFGAAIGDEKKAEGFIWHAHSKNETDDFRIKSLNFPDVIASFSAGNIPNPSKITKSHDWTKFPMGAVYILKKNGYEIKHGFNGVLLGKIPEGGLSRSASLSVNLLYSILEVNGITDIDAMKIVEMAQQLENEYIHSPCGKLDMAMIAFGKKGYASLYSQKNNSVSYLALPENSEPVDIIILDTGTKRFGLQGTDYEIRKEECLEIVRRYGKTYSFSDLSEITPEIYTILYRKLTQDNLKSRLKYVYEANQIRSKKFMKAWTIGDWKSAGEMMTLDGIGLRDDYDLSSYALETMLACARADPNVYGARLSGGGRVGACIALRKPSKLTRLEELVKEGYARSFPGLEYSIHRFGFTDGVAKLSMR